MLGEFFYKEKWEKIDRGFLYEAAMFYPSDTRRPLSFFIPDQVDSERGKIVKNDGNFSPQRIGGRFRAVEQQIVVTLKPRRVVVLSRDEMNKSQDYEFVQIAPVMSIDEKDRGKRWYTKVVKDDHPAFVYLPKQVTGRECYIDVSQIMTIHKTLLLKKREAVPTERMDVVEEAIMECLNLGFISDEEVAVS